MKHDLARILTAAACVALSQAACNSTNKPSGPQSLAAGAIEVEGAESSATVVSVNSTKREVQLRWDDGVVTTYKLGPDAINFDQIHTGDRVKARVVESVALYIGPGNLPPSASESAMVALAPKGTKPGVLMANTFTVNERITTIEAAKRRVTLVGALGAIRKVQVAPNVDMSMLKVGDDVTARVTDSMAVWVQKP